MLHIPNFQYNLKFVHRLCQDNKISEFFNVDACFLQDPLQKEPPTLLDKLHRGLYSTSGTVTDKNTKKKVYLQSKRISVSVI